MYLCMYNVCRYSYNLLHSTCKASRESLTAQSDACGAGAPRHRLGTAWQFAIASRSSKGARQRARGKMAPSPSSFIFTIAVTLTIAIAIPPHSDRAHSGAHITRKTCHAMPPSSVSLAAPYPRQKTSSAISPACLPSHADTTYEARTTATNVPCTVYGYIRIY